MAEQGERDTGQYLLASFWDAALGFWRRGSGATTWMLTTLVVVLAFVNLALQYRLNVWNRAMFDALDHKDGNAEATVVSVGHRPELEEFHSRKLVLAHHSEGARLVRDESLRSPFHRTARFLSRLLARQQAAD